ncbi:hypothetical protein [Thermocrinis albus]|nr:hypothetical protein [Thermocrinis albus]
MKGINFWSLLFASQAGGYCMGLVDEVMAGWYGLFGLISLLLLHTVYGATVGFLYHPCGSKKHL